ncbi:hypothetical protein [Bacillus sp. mrc49]|uniref:hypothetical protein n=1 Tax=Bacillus sp. mrc49 TaxID=2054913 RepID=UPI000C27969F|nr:hypothetical protein [Bacillus sp. mrc49]PJN91656.1 hypothetical protein CVN76_03780 [Bacillus sp. mrc49]
MKGTQGEKPIALRSAIVELPIILEEGNKPNTKLKDFPHASGHDGHTAILFATAEWFLFIIQSAEVMPSGTDRFVKWVCWKV